MKRKNLVSFAIFLILIPAIAILGAVFFKERLYSFIAAAVAILSCIPMFIAFERKESSSKELTVLAVLTAISVAGRFIFAWIPSFKPITALTVIAAIWLGKEAGFLVGSLSALISNFYFGQGPWTPFQMFAWGFIGLLAGIFSKGLQKSKVLLCIYGILSGILYSLTMDIWTTLWADGGFNIARYLTSAVTALPITATYAISNVVFLLLLSKPFGRKLNRLKTKYGLFTVYDGENK